MSLVIFRRTARTQRTPSFLGRQDLMMFRDGDFITFLLFFALPLGFSVRENVGGLFLTRMFANVRMTRIKAKNKKSIRVNLR